MCPPTATVNCIFWSMCDSWDIDIVFKDKWQFCAWVVSVCYGSQFVDAEIVKLHRSLQQSTYAEPLENSVHNEPLGLDILQKGDQCSMT